MRAGKSIFSSTYMSKLRFKLLLGTRETKAHVGEEIAQESVSQVTIKCLQTAPGPINAASARGIIKEIMPHKKENLPLRHQS